MEQEKRERERALFESIRIDRGTATLSTQEIDERAKKEWLKHHDRIPTLDEIDEMIREVRNGR